MVFYADTAGMLLGCSMASRPWEVYAVHAPVREHGVLRACATGMPGLRHDVQDCKGREFMPNMHQSRSISSHGGASVELQGTSTFPVSESTAGCPDAIRSEAIACIVCLIKDKLSQSSHLCWD